MTFPFPVMAPISSNILVWIPFPEIFHLVRSPNWQSAITGTVGRDSFRTHFRYWASMPFPVRRSFTGTGPRTGTGLYARGLISGTGLFQFLR